MIKFFNNFSVDKESNELVDFFNSNIEETYYNHSKIYSYKAIDILDYSKFLISNRLKLHNPSVLRVQKIDNSVSVNENTHVHTSNWNYILFLNDDIDGGELVIENITVKPKKNQLIEFPGSSPHKVLQVRSGNRFTLIVFSDTRAKFPDMAF